jgi:NADPH-dependent ferric siderophore reductase
MHARVVSIERLTPSLVRVVLGGDGLRDFAMPETTDTYVNLAFPAPGAAYVAPFEPSQIRDIEPRKLWPARRRYTVRAWDPAAAELTLDFVVHGDTGVAGAWAATAAPGDLLVLEGPSGGYRPDPGAAWHLLVGDESALPAIAASLEAIPAGTQAVVRLLCDGPDHEIELSSPARLDLAWLHRTGSPADADLLLGSLRELTFPSGSVHAFVHGEADEIRGIRRHLLAERGLPRQAMSCSPYWRRDMTDEAWREVKRGFVAQMEADVA